MIKWIADRVNIISGKCNLAFACRNLISGQGKTIKAVQLFYCKLKFIFLLFTFVACCLLNSCRQPVTPADKWLEKMVEAHGGVDALARITTIIYSGRIATRGDRGTVILVLSRPGKLRTTMKYRKRYEDRILLENRGWRNFGAGFEEVVGHSLNAMVFQYNHLNFPMGLIDGNYKILYVEENINGKLFPALKLTSYNGPPITVKIDSETGLIQQVDGRIAVGAQEVVMGVGYGDYREVAGVMLPHRIINYVNGNAIAESRYETVSVNAALDKDFFNINYQGTVQ